MLEIINQKYMNFLFEISNRPRNISELAKRGDLTLSVASTLISRWDKKGVVIKTKSTANRGPEIIITLTEYGKAQVKLLKEIKKNHQEAMSIIKLESDDPQKVGEFSKKLKALDPSLVHAAANNKIGKKEVKHGVRKNE